jgi:hypothetical protein
MHMPDVVIEGYRRPLAIARRVYFCYTTFSITADLEGKVTPC